MKYKIGQRLKQSWSDEEDEPSLEIVCLVILKDGVWKYGVLDDFSEYNNMIDFYTEKEIEEEFIVPELAGDNQ